MKALILLVVLSAPALADSPIKVFGDWVVIGYNGAQVMTSAPQKPSDRIFSMACTNHTNCFISYTAPSVKCNPDVSNHLRAADNSGYIGMKFTCKDQEWVQKSSILMKQIKVNFLNNETFIIYLPDYPNTTNTYSTKGFAQALNFILGNSNNFNQ